jgi:hypothetical protein
LLASLLALGTFLAVSLLRIRYPFQLEWMEGCVLQVVRRVVEGKAVFTAPGIEYVPVIYCPLYYYASAASTALFGEELFALRLVSLLSTLGVFALAFGLVRRWTRSAGAGLLAAGYFAACFRLGGAWFDIARNDMLFLALLLAGMGLLLNGRGRARLVVAGLLLAASFLTKQSAMFVCAPVFLACLLVDRRRLWFAAGPAVLAAGGAVLLGDRLSDGWFTYYVFELPAQHGVDSRLLRQFVVDDILARVPIVLGLAVVGLVTLVRRGPGRQAALHLGLAAGLFGASWASRMHVGGYDNVLLPGLLALSIYGAVGWAALEERWGGFRGEGRVGSPGGGAEAPGLRAGLALLALVQFGMLAYDPRAQVPSAADEAAGRELVDRLERIEGPVFIPGHGYLAVMAGHESYAHEMAIRDVSKGTEISSGETAHVQLDLRRQLRDAVRTGIFDAVVLDGDSSFGWIREHYPESEPLFQDPEVFLPVTGKASRPSVILRRGE